jgi:hypothetical protein
MVPAEQQIHLAEWKAALRAVAEASAACPW